VTHLHHKVSALIDGELSANARTRALAHARTCAHCRREIAETLEVKRRVTRMAPVEVSADLLDVVGAITLPSAATATGSRPTLLRKVFVGVGSFSAVVVALAYVVGAPDPSQAKSVRPPVEEFAAEFADSTGLAPLSDPAVGGLDTDPGSSALRPVTFAVGNRMRSWPLPSGGATVPGPAPVMTWQPGDAPEAVLQLRRAVAAPKQVGFEGARVIRSFTPGGVDTFRIEVEHVPGQGTRFDVLSANGHVRSESFVRESGERADGLEGKPIGALIAAYDLAVDGSQTIDGRSTTVISASQNRQVRARFWIDDATGLLLRRALYVDGQLVRWSGYTSIGMSPHGFMLHLPPELQTPGVTTLSKSVAPALNDKGWACPEWLTQHFRLLLLHQVDGRGGVMHAEYTDGLSTISVFEERGALDTSSLDGFRSVVVGGNLLYMKGGLPMVAVWESGGTVFTVVTDAPEQMAGGLISRLPHAADQPTAGVTSRIGKGLTRMVSAVLP
jgi:Putative zinc-finger